MIMEAKDDFSFGKKSGVDAAKHIAQECEQVKLSFSNHMSSFDAINGCLCRMKGFIFHHGIRDLLDETVILFNQVMQIFNLEYFHKTDQTGKHQQDVNILQPGIGSAYQDSIGSSDAVFHPHVG
jgi:hypothetical protein